MILTSCIKLASIRREIFRRPGWESPPADPQADEVVRARARRSRARALWADDPAAARELGIGRPDLGRGYDDG